MKLALKLILIPLAAILLLALVFFFYAFFLTKNARLDPQKLLLPSETIAIFDEKDEPVSFSSKKGAKISTLPKELKEAFLSVEDKRFYSHSGIDYRRIGKAALKNLSTFSFREGASTISQQLIKNTHLSGEKTIKRKLIEIKLTRELEKTYSKDQILELYLNSIYFGHSAFGVECAARYYFSKEPQDLTAAECATLAALVKSPNRYSPFKDPEKCKKRRNLVLALMKEQGYLSEEEKKEAEREELPKAPCEEKKSFYVSLVFEELSRLFPDFRSGDSLNVYTFLDKDLQSALEALQTDADKTLLVRGKKGGIKAIDSSCGLLKRLPASTIKPLAVYGPALEENLISPATPILDEKVNFGGYSPSNFGGTFEGYMSVRHALSYSVNVPAVKILNSLGTEKAAFYLQKMGLSVPKEDRTLSLALGGMREGFSLPELSDAYAVFLNEGMYSPSSLIRKITSKEGEILYDFEKTPKQKVFSEDVCALMNDMLKTAAKEGTAKRLKALPFEVCAKTGTGGDRDKTTDVYTIAYTSEDLVCVWLGNKDNSKIEKTGGGEPCNLAKEILETLYRSKKPENFPLSKNVEKVALDREAYENNHQILRADPASPSYLSLFELFRASHLPEETSSSFSRPKIKKPLIEVKNGAVRIILCQTYYYDYEVKRECEGQVSTIYRGKYRKEVFDNSVQAGKSYVYTITPYYQGIEGESVSLPSVYIEPSSSLPENWWNE